MRRISRGVLALLAAQAVAPGRAARAGEPSPAPPKQLTVDVDTVSAGVTYASRVGSRGVLIGGGGALGFSPLLSTTVATGTHYDEPNVLQVFEIASVQVFARFELASWLRVDTGVRAGVFVHGTEKPTGGQFAALFVAPALAWRWLWIGPRVSAGVLTEGDGPTAGALSIDYVMLRVVRGW
jgi:hypothetical protein